jgi:hypothetical protein
VVLDLPISGEFSIRESHIGGLGGPEILRESRGTDKSATFTGGVSLSRDGFEESSRGKRRVLRRPPITKSLTGTRVWSTRCDITWRT